LVSCEGAIPASCALYNRILFHVDYTATGTCYDSNLSFFVDFGDGHSTYHNDDSHSYHDGAGSYHWMAKVGYGGAGGQECVDEGDIIITQCQLACAVTASPVRREDASVTVNFEATVTETGCECIPYDVRYAWQFLCAGYSVGSSESQNPTFTFTGPLPHTWYLNASKPNGIPSQCENTGTVGGGCLAVGNLKLCADDILKDPNRDFYTLKNNVKVGALFLTSDATFEGDPTTGLGILSTGGSIFVKLKGNSTETLLQGPGILLEVDGNAKTLTLSSADPLVRYASTMSGLPLYIKSTPIKIGTNTVTITPTVYIGSPGGIALGSWEATIEYPAGGDKSLTSARLVVGQINPGIRFLDISFTYHAAQDKLEGTVSVSFPYMKAAPSARLTIRIQGGCFNGFDITATIPEFPLGTSGLSVGKALLTIDNICDLPHFLILLLGDIKILGVPPQAFNIQEMGGGYEIPYKLVLRAGTARVLGYPVGGLKGAISFKPGSAGISTMGWVNLADIYQANMRCFLSVSKLTIAGATRGTLQIPNFSCSWPNVPCRTVKAALTSAVSLPLALNAQEMDMFVSADHGQPQAMFRGMQKIGPLSLAIQLQYGGGEFDLLVGPNYADVFGIGTESVGDPRGVEKSVTLPAPQPQALFAVAANSESSALPSIYLKTPTGATITPATVGSFPGVHYTGDDGLKVALFRLDEASAGTWTLGVDNLPATDVTFQCLVPVAAPATTFTSVTPGTASVGIHTSVSPASPDTKVTFLFSDESSGGMGEPIVQDLSAASGTVSATWDTSGLTGGTYYLFARTNDGKNPPVVTYYANPITVGAVSIQPPSNLTGTLSGTACHLQWAASPSAGVGGYRVLYTDNPALPGYATSVTVLAGVEALVESLQEGKEYRFAVVAFDESGNDSAHSEPWYTGAPPPQDVRQIESGKAVSDSVSQNAWKYYRIAVPVEPASLDAWTSGGAGDVDLFLKKGGKPGASDYDYRSSGATGAETITVTTTSQPRPLSEGDWYLGIFGKQAATFSVGAMTQGGSPCAVTCTATVPTSAQPAASVAFQASAALDQCQTPVIYTWSFGDTTPNVTEQNPAHTYLTDGDYTWILTAVSGDSACVKSGEIRIGAGSPCTLDCSATVPATAAVNAPVSFDSFAIPSHCTGTPTFSWTFGDGQTSDQQSPSHAYTEAGSFGWSLTVTTAGTTPCTKSGTVTVGGKPGDCDGNDSLSIGEVQKAINMFLGTLAPACGVDCNGDGTVSIGEVQKVINGFLGNASSC
jgi:PKD repeat protein